MEGYYSTLDLNYSTIGIVSMKVCFKQYIQICSILIIPPSSSNTEIWSELVMKKYSVK